MNSKVETISKEMIKPSSQTPDHLKISELSFYDQFAPPVYISVVFFFEADQTRGLIASNHVGISQKLKKSLSETLTSFFFLAGRVGDDGTAIDCNDAGAEFVEARVRGGLAESIREGDMDLWTKLLPLNPVTTVFSEHGTLLFLKLNMFECGGIAIGVSASHRVVDVSSVLTFVSAWAATHRDQRQNSPIELRLGRYFPVKEMPVSNIWKTVGPDQTLSTGVLLFTKEKLAALNRAATSSTGSTVENPTRVELVSAFIWKHVSEFFLQKGPIANFHPVNLRARVGQSHQVLQNVIGNFLGLALMLPGGEGVGEYHELVRAFRTSLRSISGEIVEDSEKLERVVGEVVSVLNNEEIKEWYRFTSWSKFPVYEVDFGWGKPEWVCLPPEGVRNAIILVDTKNGEDVQVWINMDGAILDILENQLKLV